MHCMACIVEFNITIIYMIIFYNKCTHVIMSFTCYMKDRVPVGLVWYVGLDWI